MCYQIIHRYYNTLSDQNFEVYLKQMISYCLDSEVNQCDNEGKVKRSFLID